MKINKFIKEEIFPDGTKKYSGYIEKVIKKQWFWGSEVKKTYDLTKSENNFLFEDRDYPFLIGEYFTTNSYKEMWETMVNTLSKNELLLEKNPIRTNIIKLKL